MCYLRSLRDLVQVLAPVLGAQELDRACEAADDLAAADDAFRQSVEVLEATKSRPELAQTLLVYGRFRSRSGNGDGRVLIERTLALFEEMDATGWIAEARAAL